MFCYSGKTIGCLNLRAVQRVFQTGIHHLAGQMSHYSLKSECNLCFFLIWPEWDKIGEVRIWRRSVTYLPHNGLNHSVVHCWREWVRAIALSRVKNGATGGKFLHTPPGQLDFTRGREGLETGWHGSVWTAIYSPRWH
jgi:hypothetical protein